MLTTTPNGYVGQDLTLLGMLGFWRGTSGIYSTNHISGMTRTVCTTFAKDDEVQFLRGYLEKLPPNKHDTRGILSSLIWVCLQRTSL